MVELPNSHGKKNKTKNSIEKQVRIKKVKKAGREKGVVPRIKRVKELTADFDFVLESCPEQTVSPHRLLDHTADRRLSLQLGTLELGHLRVRVKHVLCQTCVK